MLIWHDAIQKPKQHTGGDKTHPMHTRRWHGNLRKLKQASCHCTNCKMLLLLHAAAKMGHMVL